MNFDSEVRGPKQQIPRAAKTISRRREMTWTAARGMTVRGGSEGHEGVCRTAEG
jgi:hypothetical protein